MAIVFLMLMTQTNKQQPQRPSSGQAKQQTTQRPSSGQANNKQQTTNNKQQTTNNKQLINKAALPQ